MSYINLLDIIYPVGSIYFSNEDTSPSEIIGGTWQKLEPYKYLMSAGNTLQSGSLGGSNTVTLTLGQMPKHFHYWTQSSKLVFGGTGTDNATLSLNSGPDSRRVTENGSSEPHNNMPAYYATNIWIRIS